MDIFGFTIDPEILKTIAKGGWVVLTLIGLSLIALTIALAKVFQLIRLTLGQRQKIDALVVKLPAGDSTQIRQALTRLRHPVAHPLKPVVTADISAKTDLSLIQDEVERLSLRQVDGLNAGLKVLGLIATIAPLLGLLGTVLGMIEAFQKLQAAGNKVDPSILSGGIWEALLTTAAGLLVAIPVTVILNFLQSRVTATARVMEDTLSVAMTTLKHRLSSDDQAIQDAA